MYEFKMVQLPQNFVVKKDTGTEIAAHLQNIIFEHSKQGWEFYRIDQVGVAVQPGCMGSLMGVKQTFTYYNIVSFRRLLPAAS